MVKPHEYSPPETQAEYVQPLEIENWKAVEPPNQYRSTPFANCSYFCKSHNEECTYWCVTCTLPCCDSCINEPDHHANHEIQKREGTKTDIFIDDPIVNKSRGLRSHNVLLAQSKTKKNEILKWIDRQDIYSSLCQSKIDDSIQKVEEHAKQAMAFVQDEQQRLTTLLNQIKEDSIKLSQKNKNMITTISNSIDLLSEVRFEHNRNI